MLGGMGKAATWHRCCKELRGQESWSCDTHADRSSCPDAIVTYVPRFREYGLIVHDGGQSHLVIRYCPWCGSQLPESLRGEWFARIEALGMEPESSDLPVEMRTDAWWQQVSST